MMTIEINKVFPSQKECDEWENKHLSELIPKGKVLLMVNHSRSALSDEVKLESLFVI